MNFNLSLKLYKKFIKLIVRWKITYLRYWINESESLNPWNILEISLKYRKLLVITWKSRKKVKHVRTDPRYHQEERCHSEKQNSRAGRRLRYWSTTLIILWRIYIAPILLRINAVWILHRVTSTVDQSKEFRPAALASVTRAKIVRLGFLYLNNNPEMKS